MLMWNLNDASVEGGGQVAGPVARWHDCQDIWGPKWHNPGPFDDAVPTGNLKVLCDAKGWNWGPLDKFDGEIGGSRVTVHSLQTGQCAPLSWEHLNIMPIQKEYKGVPIPIVYYFLFRGLCAYHQLFQTLVVDFQYSQIFYQLLRRYIWWSPIWYFEMFFLSSFLLFLFFSFLFFSFLFFSFLFPFLSLSLSWGPFSSGAPGHCPTTPPASCATARCLTCHL